MLKGSVKPKSKQENGRDYEHTHDSQRLVLNGTSITALCDQMQLDKVNGHVRYECQIEVFRWESLQFNRISLLAVTTHDQTSGT